MKNKRGVIIKRQQELLQKLKSNKKIDVNLMAKKLHVSSLTIRRDLDLFEKQGFIRRYYGGAEIIEGTVSDDPTKTVSYTGSNDRTIDYRKIVAEKAALLVEDGDTIFINSSRTALAMLPFIHRKNVIVITNNGNVLSVPHDQSISIILTGGEINTGKYSLVGDFALSAIKKTQADKCFIGVSGISSDGQISTAVLQETMINMLMIEHTKNDVVILADNTRIGKTNNFIIADIHQITHIVTDTLADMQILEKFSAEGVMIVQAKVNN